MMVFRVRCKIMEPQGCSVHSICRTPKALSPCRSKNNNVSGRSIIRSLTVPFYIIPSSPTSSSKTPSPPNLRHVLLQTSQSLLCPFQHIIFFTDRKPQPILRHPHILLCIEFCWRDGSNSQLHDQKPSEFEVTWTVRDLRREVVIVRQFDASEVREDEVAAFGFRILFITTFVNTAVISEKWTDEGKNAQVFPIRQKPHKTSPPSPSSPSYSVPRNPTPPPFRIPPPLPLARVRRWRSKCGCVQRLRSGLGLRGR